MHQRSAFLSTVSRLAQSSHREDQLTQCFAACFNESATFRQRVLELLRHRCQIGVTRAAAVHWSCRTQVATRTAGQEGRLDIVLAPGRPDGSSIPGAITLESKLDAPLTKRQLLRYRAGGAGTLVAITERRPDVSEAWLSSQHIGCLRWHDVHRAMPVRGRSVDAFVCRAFRDYLEDCGMAHRAVKRADLVKLGKTLRTVGKPGAWNIGNLAFGTADDVLALLKEVGDELADNLAAASTRTVRRHGPSYYYHVDPDSQEGQHQLAVDVRAGSTAKGGGDRRRLVVMLAFPDAGATEPHLAVFGHDMRRDWVVGGYHTFPMDDLLDGDGHLSAQSVVECARRASIEEAVPLAWS